MIKLKKIRRANDEIRCEAYVEDCSQPVPLVFDIKNKDFKKYNLPKGYEWCESHIHHAKRYFASVLDKDEIPSERTIMWY